MLLKYPNLEAVVRVNLLSTAFANFFVEPSKAPSAESGQESSSSIEENIVDVEDARWNENLGYLIHDANSSGHQEGVQSGTNATRIGL